MSAISNSLTRATPRSRRFGGPAFARARAILIVIWETFAESRELERAAHKRFPFAEW